MKFAVDTAAHTLVVDEGNGPRTVPLYSPEGFRLVSDLWLKVGWDQKHTYTFSWLGRPVIQLPDDLMRAQEVIHRLAPDVIVETGVAHGGSLVFWATLCRTLGRGHVLGVDIEIRPHNRAAIEAHFLAPHITLIEGGSTDAATLARVRERIRPADRVLVFLDSNHTYGHVRAELDAYAPLVTPGSYIVATDGIMRDVADVPRGQAGWITDNPASAAVDFAREHPEFALETPPWPFNESPLERGVTHWPQAWLKRREP